MADIRPIPPETVDLMVAGEAIDSLAAAVRELVENAVDAGGDRISIQLLMDAWTVRVTDNGTGFSESELHQAALAFCTSKLAGDASLDCVRTLGFRGEALHSLARVSQLDLRSRQRDSEAGWWANYHPDGTLDRLRPVAAAIGTIATAKDLFANWPARRAALGDHKRESRRAIEVVQAAALAHPHITWSLDIDGKSVLNIWPSDDVADVLVQFIPRLERSQLGVFSNSNTLVNSEQNFNSQGPQDHPQIDIAFGLPDRYHRHRPDWIRLAINGRFVQMPLMQQTIQSAFRRMLPRDRHPLCIVRLQVPPQEVDWNRHPAKQELYLHRLDHYRALVSESIAAAITDCPPSAYQRSRQFLNQRPSTFNLQEEPADYTTSQLAPIRVLGQLQNTYILVETEAGMWLLEQHVAHERVRYEQLQELWELVPVEEPILLTGLSDQQQQQLERMGIEVEAFGDMTWAVRKIPKLLLTKDSELDDAKQQHQEPGREDLPQALIDLSLCGDLEAARVTLACRTAVKNGTPLHQQDMEKLARQWQQTQNPHTCPHGRPTYLVLNEADLSRFFRRNWTVCSQSWGEDPRKGIGRRGLKKGKRLGDRLKQDIQDGRDSRRA